jgi:inner membrane protein
MASLISHAVTPLGIGSVFARPKLPKRVWVIGADCSMLPDIAVIGFRLGIHYGDFWGHRGVTHSLLFASVIATLALVAGLPRALAGLSRGWLWLYFFLATASHGILHAMTNGGLGAAFFSPVDKTRYFFPGTPFWFRRYRLRDFSANAARQWCIASLCGPGFLRGCWHY